jgi:hypothetical protein
MKMYLIKRFYCSPYDNQWGTQNIMILGKVLGWYNGKERRRMEPFLLEILSKKRGEELRLSLGTKNYYPHLDPVSQIYSIS